MKCERWGWGSAYGAAGAVSTWWDGAQCGGEGQCKMRVRNGVEFIFFAAAHCCCLPSVTNFRAQPPRASDYLLRLSGSHPCPQQQSRPSEASSLMTRGYHSLSLSSVTTATVGLPRPYGVSHSNKSPFYPYYFYQLCSARELKLIQ